MLEGQPLGRRLDDELGLAERTEIVDALHARERGLARVGIESPALHLEVEVGGDPAHAGGQRLVNRIEEQRARPRPGGQLGDPRTHGAGAEHADDACRLGHAGTSALTPVSARPMMSFWICEVPSYSVVTRTSRNQRSTGWSST